MFLLMIGIFVKKSFKLVNLLTILTLLFAIALVVNQKAYIKVVNSREDLNFPSSIHMDNTTIVAGSMWEKSSQQGITNGISASTDTSQTEAGAAWVYRF